MGANAFSGQSSKILSRVLIVIRILSSSACPQVDLDDAYRGQRYANEDTGQARQRYTNEE